MAEKASKGNRFFIPLWQSDILAEGVRAGLIQEMVGDKSASDLLAEFKDRVGCVWPNEVDIEMAYAAHNLAGVVFYGGLLAVQEGVRGGSVNGWWTRLKGRVQNNGNVRVYREFLSVFKKISADVLVLSGTGSLMRAARAEVAGLTGEDLYKEIRREGMVHVTQFEPFSKVYTGIGQFITGEAEVLRLLIENFLGVTAREQFDSELQTYLEEADRSLFAQSLGEEGFDLEAVTAEALGLRDENNAGEDPCDICERAGLANVAAMVMGMFCLESDESISNYVNGYRAFLEAQAVKYGELDWPKGTGPNEKNEEI